MEKKFINFVAEVMEVDAAELSLETTYKEHPKWDSMMFLRIIMEIEEEYGVQIPIEQTAGIQNLSDLYRYVEAK